MNVIINVIINAITMAAIVWLVVNIKKTSDQNKEKAKEATETEKQRHEKSAKELAKWEEQEQENWNKRFENIRQERKEIIEKCEHNYEPFRVCNKNECIGGYDGSRIFNSTKILSLFNEETISSLLLSDPKERRLEEVGVYGVVGITLRDYLRDKHEAIRSEIKFGCFDKIVPEIIEPDELEMLDYLSPFIYYNRTYLAPVDLEGREILQCSKCGKFMVGEKVVEIPDRVPEFFSGEIDYQKPPETYLSEEKVCEDEEEYDRWRKEMTQHEKIDKDNLYVTYAVWVTDGKVDEEMGYYPVVQLPECFDPTLEKVDEFQCAAYFGFEDGTEKRGGVFDLLYDEWKREGLESIIFWGKGLVGKIEPIPDEACKLVLRKERKK